LGDPHGYAVYYAILTGQRKSGASLMENQRKMLNDPKKLANFGFEQGVGFIPFGGLTLSVFRTLTRDDVSPIRAAAAEVLITDPGPRTTEALKTAVADRSWVVRQPPSMRLASETIRVSSLRWNLPSTMAERRCVMLPLRQSFV
jgi:hypothetical protein